MPTPQELRMIAEVAAREKFQREELEKAKRKEENSKHEVEAGLLVQERARAAIDHAESNMTKVAQEGLSAALVYQAEGFEVLEQTLRSLGTKGASIDTPDRYFCSGAAKIVFDHFKDKGFNVVVVSHPGPADPKGQSTKRYYVKVGW